MHSSRRPRGPNHKVAEHVAGVDGRNRLVSIAGQIVGVWWYYRYGYVEVDVFQRIGNSKEVILYKAEKRC